MNNHIVLRCHYPPNDIPDTNKDVIIVMFPAKNNNYKDGFSKIGRLKKLNKINGELIPIWEIDGKEIKHITLWIEIPHQIGVKDYLNDPFYIDYRSFYKDKIFNNTNKKN